MRDLEVSETFLMSVVEALKTSSAAMEASRKSIEAVTEELRAMRDEGNASRDEAVNEIKRHITNEATSREGWWRKAFTLAATALVLANLLSVPLGRVLAVLKL